MYVRPALAEDALAVETVRINGWKTAYDGLVPSSYLDRLVVDAPRRRELMTAGDTTTLIAVEGDAVLGMAVHGPARDTDAVGLVELYALYVEPAAWRSGVGTALLAACPVPDLLWVLAANERARAFYARHGYVPDGHEKVLDLDGPITEIRMVLGRG